MSLLQAIQHNVERASASAMELRDELVYQGLDEVAEDALTLRDQLEEVVRNLRDLEDRGENERIFPREVVRVLDEADEQGLLVLEEHEEADTPFNLTNYLFHYNNSAYASRREFSKTTGIAPSVLLRLEKGETKKPHKETVKKLAKALLLHPSVLDTRFNKPTSRDA